MTDSRVALRLVPCTVCGGEAHQPLYADELQGRAPPVDYDFSAETRKTFAIVRCRGCGHVFTNPMPSLHGVYEETVDQVYVASEPQRRRTAQSALRAIRAHAPGGRLLDVGCATGVFLDEAAAFFDVEGIELSEWAATRAARRHTVHRTPLAEFEPREPFDVVTLFGVIEHFDDPHAEIAAAARLLAPGGLIVVYTGDVAAWLPRLMGKRWWWFQGMHLHYFSRRTLSRLLRRCGFEVVAHQTYEVNFQLFSLAKSLSRYSLGRLAAPLLGLRPIRDLMVPLRLSGEMLLLARRA